MILHVDNVSYRYRAGPLALDGVSMDLEPGNIVGLLGPNGSGKTTLITLLSRQRPPQTGRVWPEGCAYADVSIGWASCEGLLFNDVPFGWFLEHIWSPALGIPQESTGERIDYLARSLSMRAHLHKKPRHLSHGMRIKASLMLALMEKPRLLLLDEPFNGLDVHAVDQSMHLITEETKANSTITIIADHQVEILEPIIDTAVFISKGKIVLVEDRSRLLSDYGTLREAYLEHIRI